ncbi:MAG: hypothetical protein ACYDA2_07345, partial [Acidimicrobiales bacterium]
APEAPPRRTRSAPAAEPADATAEPSEPPVAPAEGAAAGPELVCKSLGALRRQSRGAAGPSAQAAPTTPASSSTEAPAAPRAANGSGGAVPTRDELVQAWGDGLLAQLSNRARARFRVGRFLAVEDGAAVFGLPNETHRSYCEEVRTEVERLLASHFGAPVPMRLVVDAEAEPAGRAPGRTGAAAAGDPSPADDREHEVLLDPEVLAAETEAAGVGPSAEDRLKQMFPGAEEV